MIARLNIFVLLFAMVVLTITSAQSPSRIEPAAATGHSAQHVPQPDYTNPATARASHSGHASKAAPGHDHKRHGDEKSCWEHCTDALERSLQLASPREVDAASAPGKYRLIGVYGLSSSVPSSVAMSVTVAWLDVQDHRTGVSRILRTNMRLRN